MVKLVSKKNINDYCLTFLMVSNTALVIIGFSETIIWVIITFWLLLDFIVRLFKSDYRIGKHEFALFTPLFVLLIIDKGNDFLYSFDVRDILAIITGFLLISKIVSLARQKNNIFWKSFFHACHFSFLLLLAYFILLGESIKDVDQYLNYYLLMVLFYHFWTSNNKFLSGLILMTALLFYYIAFEPRFLVVCVIIMLGLSLFNKKSFSFKSTCLKLFWVISPPILIIGAIWLEVFTVSYVGVSDEFTGRGFIWYNFLTLPVSHNSILFGMPSSEAFLKGVSNSLIFNDSSFVQEFIGMIINGGNTHNGLVYIFYNAGLIGIFSFYIFMWKCYKNKELVNTNWTLIIIIALMFLLFGRSLYGVYFLGNMLLYVLVIPVNLKKKS